MDNPRNAENIDPSLSALANVMGVETIDVFQFRAAAHQMSQSRVMDLVGHPTIDFALGEINCSSEAKMKINSLLDFLTQALHLQDIPKWQIIEDPADDFQ